MEVFSSYTAADGDYLGNPSQGRIETAYGFKNTDFPILYARTTYDIYHDENGKLQHGEKKYEYFLCVGVDSEGE